MQIRNVECKVFTRNNFVSENINNRQGKTHLVTVNKDSVSFGKVPAVVLSDGDKLLAEIAKAPKITDIIAAIKSVHPGASKNFGEYIAGIISDASLTISDTNKLNRIVNNKLKKALLNGKLSPDAKFEMSFTKNLSLNIGDKRYFLKDVIFEKGLFTKRELKSYSPKSLIKGNSPVIRKKEELKAVTLKFESGDDLIDLKLIYEPINNNITMQLTSSNQGNILQSKFLVFKEQFPINRQKYIKNGVSAKPAHDHPTKAQLKIKEILDISENVQSGIRFSGGLLSNPLRNLFRACEDFGKLRAVRESIENEFADIIGLVDAVQEAF